MQPQVCMEADQRMAYKKQATPCIALNGINPAQLFRYKRYSFYKGDPSIDSFLRLFQTSKRDSFLLVIVQCVILCWI